MIGKGQMNVVTMVVIAIVVLVIFLLVIGDLTGKGLGAIGYIRELIRGGR